MNTSDSSRQKASPAAKKRGPDALSVVLRVFCLVPFLTGAADLWLGAKILTLSGVAMPEQVTRDAILNSEIRFWGAIWFGYGVALWWTSFDLRARADMLRILLGTLFLSGLGRALSTTQFGWASSVLTGAMILEIVGPPVLLVWHARRLRQT